MADFKPAENVIRMINSNTVVVFALTDCQDSDYVKELLLEMGAAFTSYELDCMEHREKILEFLEELTNTRTLPMVFANGTYIGGADDIRGKYIKGELFKLLYKPSGHY